MITIIKIFVSHLAEIWTFLIVEFQNAWLVVWRIHGLVDKVLDSPADRDSVIFACWVPKSALVNPSEGVS